MLGDSSHSLRELTDSFLEEMNALKPSAVLGAVQQTTYLVTSSRASVVISNSVRPDNLALHCSAK